SVDAEPPSPTCTERAPAASAAAITCPSPRVLARYGSGRAIIGRPTTWARSHTAASPTWCQRPSVGPPSGPVAGTSCQSPSPAAAATTSVVPSPPSAWPSTTTSSSRRTRDHPAANAPAAPVAVVEPLNESGQNTMRDTVSHEPSCAVGERWATDRVKHRQDGNKLVADLFHKGEWHTGVDAVW